ncbi:MAG: hypothetical protein U0V75_15920 [Ferruginibacter sp.]
MKKSLKWYVIIFCLATGTAVNAPAQQTGRYNIFTYTVPKGFLLKDNKDKLFFEKKEGKEYCQLFLYPANAGTAGIEKDFEQHWNFFARNPAQGVNDPATKEKDSQEGWDFIMASAKGSYNKKPFVVTVTTVSGKNLSYYFAAVFSSEKYITSVQEFASGIEPHEELFDQNNKPASDGGSITATVTGKNSITKFNTNFDDGWHASALAAYVQVTKQSTEVRLHYIDAALDDARPNTVDAPEYYWSKYVAPFFTVSNPQKWAGVQYPVIYFMEGNAINRQTGKACYVAIKIVYSGGARPIVIIAPDQRSYQQEFPHPNDADRMLNYNKFAITTADITGTWNGSGGGGVEYYNAYSGTYAGMSAVSATDAFTFSSNGTYSSTYRSASMNNGGTQFGGQDFKGNFSVTDWTITATNRLHGKTTVYNAQLVAVKNGYLLYMADSENAAMNYMLYKSK